MKKFKGRKTLMRGISDKNLAGAIRELSERQDILLKLLNHTREGLKWCLEKLDHPSFANRENRTESGIVLPPGFVVPAPGDDGAADSPERP